MAKKNEIERLDQTLPKELNILPVMGKPIFPGIFTSIMIAQKNDMKMIDKVIKGDKVIGLTLVKNEDADNPTTDDLYKMGTAAKIVKSNKLPDGQMNLLLTTISRFSIKKAITNKPGIVAVVQYHNDILDSTGNELKGMTRAILSEAKKLSEENPFMSEEMRLNMVNIDNPGKIADFIVSMLNIDKERLQDILETLSLKERMEKTLLILKREEEVLHIQQKIATEMNTKIEKNQREYFLREELKAIKKELGEPTDSKTSDVLRFGEIIKKLPLSKETRKQVDLELEKFSFMDPSSSEFTLTRTYLETITLLPWAGDKPIDFDLEDAQKILERDHYGMEDVKERIIEYLAVKKLKKDNRGSIICLVGPPGVGKTSIGKSIASALGKKFFRFSVGGMKDEAEIKGHRRTYIGAMPGKIIQGLKITGAKGPVFMIDEIDKLGNTNQGDPSSALLEVLDPEQNIEFRDHYLDLPFDLSEILFITTANSLDTVPRPLLDRMEIIRLSGYIDDEKVEIAKKYIIPKSLKKHGLMKKHIRYNKKVLMSIAEQYARDAGMRSFEKYVDKIHRKVAKKVIQEKEKLPISISPDNLEEYLKKPLFKEDQLTVADTCGMAVGLAWTSMGGDTLVIEALNIPGKTNLQLTGQMGDVMKESAGIAFTYLQKLAVEYNVPKDYFEKNTIHLHIPDGATPKDGPSAGITMTTALLSLVKGVKIRPHLAMTGELSLTGKVLPIGGLKEKTIAAKRAKIKEIIIPQENLRDLDEIPEHIRKGIKFHPVSRMEEVVKIAFKSI